MALLSSILYGAYKFVFPSPQPLPIGVDATEALHKVVFSPYVPLTQRLSLLPGVAKLQFRFLTTSILDLLFRVGSFTQVNLITYITRIARRLMFANHHYPVLSFILGVPGFLIALHHFHYMLLWCTLPAPPVPRHTRRFRRTRTYLRQAMLSGWAWRLFCFVQVSCWLTSVAYQGLILRFSPISYSDFCRSFRSSRRLSGRAQLFRDRSQPYSITKDLRGWDYSGPRPTHTSNPLKRVYRDSCRSKKAFVSHCAYHHGYCPTVPTPPKRPKDRSDLRKLALLDDGWAKPDPSESEVHQQSHASTNDSLKTECQESVGLFSRFMQRRYDAFNLHEANMPDEEPEITRSTHLHDDLFQLQSQKKTLYNDSGQRFRRNKYGVTDLSPLYGALAPTKIVHGESRCLAFSKDTKAKIAALKDIQFSLRSAAKNSHCTETFTICIDSGCSISITNCISDFIKPPDEGDFGTMKTVDGKTEIKAFGLVSWKVYDVEGNLVQIRAPAYYVPASDQRLLSPQHYAQQHQWGSETEDMFGGNPTRVWVHLADERKRFNKELFRIEAPISSFDNLPYVIGYADHNNEVQEETDSESSDEEPEPSEPKPSEPHCTCGNTCAKCKFDTAYNMEVLSEANQNLTASQKELLLDHQRLGHINMSHLQELYRSRDISCSFDGCSKDSDPCIHPRHSGVSSCEVPGCLACYAAKAKRRSTGAKHSTTDKQKQFGVSTDQLKPGDQVHVDNYESSIRGRLTHTYGKEPRHAQYCGGTIFYDAATGLIKVYHQSDLTGNSTVKSKRKFEHDASQCGVTIKNYHADNGIFTGMQWKSVLLDEGQHQGVSGTGAHHQNPHAERAIGTVTTSARAMLLHLQIHWPDEYDTRLWPLALSYATWLYNHTPKRNGLAPIEIFCGIKTSCEYLKRAKVFGAPVYVLDPKLQDGRKIPKWSTRSRRGMFLGFSPDHSSSVGLILNLKTGSITPQFHFVVDQKFTTVPGGQMDRTLPEITDGEVEFFIKSSWNTDDRVDALDSWDPSVDGQRPTLAPEWNPTPISDPELPFIPSQPQATNHPPPTAPPTAPPAPPPVPTAPPAPAPDPDFDTRLLDEVLQPAPARQYPSEGGDQDGSLVQGGLDPRSVEFADPVEFEIIPQDDPVPQETQAAAAPDPSPSPRRRSRTRNEPDRFGFDKEGTATWQHQGSMHHNQYCDESNTQRWKPHPILKTTVRKGCYLLPRPRVGRFSLFDDEPSRPNVLTTFYSTPAVSKAMRLNWKEPSEDPMANHFEYLLEACSCPISEELWYLHPFALQIRLNQATDQPTLQEILNMPDDEKVLWFEAMNKELNALWANGCFVITNEEEAKGRQIVPLTWAFKVKTRPDGSFLKRKARLCLRGDKMIEGLEEGKSADETSGYAPVVDWGTIRMLLTMSVNFDLKTTAVDFRNAFTQKKLDRQHYASMPPMIADFPEYQGKILRVRRSLYGSKYAAKLSPRQSDET